MVERHDVDVELKRQEEALATALAAGDGDTLSRLLAADYVFTSATGETWGRDRALADVADPAFCAARVTSEVERVVSGSDVALVTGRSFVEAHVGERSLSGVFRFAHVWRQSAGGWQLAAGHTSRLA